MIFSGGGMDVAEVDPAALPPPPQRHSRTAAGSHVSRGVIASVLCIGFMQFSRLKQGFIK